LANTKQSPSHALAPDHPELTKAIEALRSGELVIYPTETLFAIGADALSQQALERIYAIKGREPAKPIAMIAADAASAFSVASIIPEAARRLAAEFWPGPLTLVLPPRTGLPDGVVGPDGVGIRVSPHPVACALAAGLGHPITATSANLSGVPVVGSIAEARATFGASVRFYLDGPVAGGPPSTVVAITDDTFRIIRPGIIGEDQIAACLTTPRSLHEEPR
jgi:L-threonylcarbamoyladenylate synthase